MAGARGADSEVDASAFESNSLLERHDRQRLKTPAMLLASLTLPQHFANRFDQGLRRWVFEETAVLDAG
jgi:hypothetical protein